MNEETSRALAIVARYQARSVRMPYYHVGNGPYALIAVFQNGDRQVKACGFDTASDAEYFMAYADPAGKSVREAIANHMKEQGVELQESNFSHFEVASLWKTTAAVAVADMQKRFGEIG